MNYYALLPLNGFLANILLGCYVLYRSPGDRLNIFFSLFAFAVAIWALSDFLVMTSSTAKMALLLDRVGTVGSSTMSVFLLHFFLIFTKNKFLSRKISYVPLYLFLYLPSLFFLFTGLLTNLITENLTASDVDYFPVYGPLYNLLTLYITAYVIASILICYKFYKETTSKKEKNQAKIVIYAVSIPTIFGIVTQVVPPFFGLQTIRMTTTITAIMAVLIAYAIFKYRLMAQMSFSISRKLVAGFLTVSLFTGIVGYISITISQEELQKQIGENSVLLAQQTLDKIDRHIYYKIEEFQAYSTNLAMQEVLIESNLEFENLNNIQDYINETDLNWTSVSKETITPFMQELMNNTLSKELREKIEFFEEKYGYPVYGEIFITNRYGADIAQTGKTSDYRQDDEIWWQNTKKDGLYVEDVEYDESAEIYSISICLKVDDEDGNFLGVIKVVSNIQEVINILREINPKEDDDEQRMIPGHKEHELMHYDLLNKNGRIIYSSENHTIFEGFSQELFSKFKGEEGYFTYYIDTPGIDGKEKLFAHTHSEGYKDYEGLGWLLIIQHETEEIFAPIMYMQNIIIFVTFAIMLLSFLFGIIFSRSLSKPIMILRNIALKMSKGNLDIKIKINSRDEIGQLSSAFNLMGKNLKHQQENLKNIVAERTKDLERKLDELQRFKKVTVGRELKMIELKKRIKELEGDMKK